MKIKTKEITIVIPYIAAGLELKYAIRSIEKHYPGSEIMIIGDKPGGFKNLWHIPATDTPGLIFKERNIFNKVLIAAEILSEFLFMNDDHFLMEQIKESYYEKTVKYWLLMTGPNSYQQTLKNTYETIGAAPYYDIHCPMMMKSEKVKELQCYRWNKEFGYCFKSLYAHTAQIEGVEYPDLKFREPLSKVIIETMIKGRKFFSTGNRAINNDMIQVLEDLYPQKSIYEK